MAHEQPQPNSTGRAPEREILLFESGPLISPSSCFLINLALITYIVDLEQLVIDDSAKFAYPLWPPALLIDLVHWWGNPSTRC